MLAFRKVIRLFCFSVIFMLFLMFMQAAQLLDRFKIINFKNQGLPIGRFFSQLILKTFSIKQSSNIKHRKTPTLYIANHLSYLDVVLLFSRLNTLFITSTEMRDSIGLGWLCKGANCLFVNRKSIWNLPEEIEQITKRFDEGYSVVLFPEATTSDGQFVKSFKSSLIEAAVKRKVPVIPICINLERINGRKVEFSDRDSYCWYDDMTFLPHLKQLSEHKSIELSISELKSLDLNKFNNRKSIAKESRKRITSAFHPLVSAADS